jgi:hypothetical protein
MLLVMCLAKHRFAQHSPVDVDQKTNIIFCLTEISQSRIFACNKMNVLRDQSIALSKTLDLSDIIYSARFSGEIKGAYDIFGFESCVWRWLSDSICVPSFALRLLKRRRHNIIREAPDFAAAVITGSSGAVADGTSLSLRS